MEPIDIRILLMRAKKSQNSIAKELGITQSFVAQVILGIRKTQYVREAIAGAADKRVEDLWPSCAKASAGKPVNSNHKRKAA